MIGAFSESSPYDVRRSRCFSAPKVIQIVSMSIHSMAPAFTELFLPARCWIVRLLRLSFFGLLPITILECLPRPPDTKWIECRGNDGGYKVSAFQWNCRCTLYTRFASTKIFNLIKNRLSSFLLSLSVPLLLSSSIAHQNTWFSVFAIIFERRSNWIVSHTLTLCAKWIVYMEYAWRFGGWGRVSINISVNTLQLNSSCNASRVPAYSINEKSSSNAKFKIQTEKSSVHDGTLWVRRRRYVMRTHRIICVNSNGCPRWTLNAETGRLQAALTFIIFIFNAFLENEYISIRLKAASCTLKLFVFVSICRFNCWHYIRFATAYCSIGWCRSHTHAEWIFIFDSANV